MSNKLTPKNRCQWRRVRPSIAAAVTLGIIALFAIIYVVTDKGRIKITVDGPALAVKVDGGEVRIDGLDEPITLRSGEHELTVVRGNTETETRKFIVRRSRFEALRVEYVPKIEKNKPAGAKDAAEPNRWPEALALAGQTLAGKDRFLAMSRDCRRLAAATRMGVRIVEAPKASMAVAMKKRPRDHEGHVCYIWAAAFSPEGEYLAVSPANAEIEILEAASGKGVCRANWVGGTSLAYSTDGKRIAVSGHADKAVYVADAATGKRLAKLGPHSALTDCVAYSPDGKQIASGSGVDAGDEWGAQFGTASDLRIWDPDTGTGTELQGHRMRVNAVAFSPDGDRLASASSDKTVKVWNVATKRCLVTFDNHRAIVRNVRFSPDGRLIASTGEENCVRLWHAATGREIAILAGLPGTPEFIQFSPEGHWIYSCARSILKAWETPAGADESGSAVATAGASEVPRRSSVKKLSVPGVGSAAPKVGFEPVFNGNDLATDTPGPEPVAPNGSFRTDGVKESEPSRPATESRLKAVEKTHSPGTLLVRVDEFSEPRNGLPRDLSIPHDPDHGESNNVYFVYSPPGWRAWNIHNIRSDGTCEVVGRVFSEHPSKNAAWTVSVIGGPTGRGRGFVIKINMMGQLFLEPSPWDEAKAFRDIDPRIGPIVHRAIKPGSEFNKLLLITRKREVAIFVNGVQICAPVRFGYDITPAKLEFGAKGPGKKRAEFDRLELREQIPPEEPSKR